MSLFQTIDHLDIIRGLNVVLSVIALVIWIRITMNLKEKWRYGVPMLVWTANILLFYIAVWLDKAGTISMSVDAFNLWSAYLRTLSLALAIGIGVVVAHEKWYINKLTK